MAAKRKQRQPSEDLAAAVADIINSPITRVNLGFLHLGAEAPRDEPETTVAASETEGVESKPMGLEQYPMGAGPKPMGLPDGSADQALDANSNYKRLHVVSEGSGSTVRGVTQAGAEDSEPMGVEFRPMGHGAGLHDSAINSLEGAPLTPSTSTTPLGQEPRPPGEEIKPVGFGTGPLGFEIRPMGLGSSQAMFQAEQLGLLFPASRVKRIRLAQDALSHVEEKVYDLLWGVKNQSRDAYRFAEFSLQRIANEGRLNIKTVRELLPRLIDKGFISIEREADVRRNKPTQYRVLSYLEVLADQRRRKRFWIVKTGKGVFYAHPVSVGVNLSEDQGEPEPMGFEAEPGGFVSSPGGHEADLLAAPSAMGFNARPMGLGSEPVGHSSKPAGFELSPEGLGVLSKFVREGLNVQADEALLKTMVLECRERAEKATGAPATEEEILHFVAAKVRVLRHSTNLRNPLAVLRKAVGECFSGQPFIEYRQAEIARKQRELAEALEFEKLLVAQEAEEQQFRARQELWSRVSLRHKTERGYDLKAIAEDAELDAKGREVATERMKRVGRFAPAGL